MVQPAMYYATPGQIAAVLPSNTPTGNATITVTYNNATSNAFSFQVVPYALGLNTYFGSGSGLVLATDNATGDKITYTNSAKPGETVVLYGSGLGADTATSAPCACTPCRATVLRPRFGRAIAKAKM